MGIMTNVVIVMFIEIMLALLMVFVEVVGVEVVGVEVVGVEVIECRRSGCGGDCNVYRNNVGITNGVC